MRFQLLSLIAALAPFVLADIQLTAPAGGASVRGGSVTLIEWKESGAAPSIADLTNYVINLCAGGNDQGTFECSLTTLQSGGTFANGDSTTGIIPINVGATSPNGYFLQIVSTSTTGLQVINYGPRFGLTDMTGSFTPQMQQAIASIAANDYTSPAKSQTNPNHVAPGAGDSGLYGVPYQQQQGLTRYAPMQPQPGTKITVTSAAPLFPTSSAVLATTWLPAPTVLTTLTQVQTFSISSMQNTAAPAAQPSDDMAKFLARWKD